MSEKQQDERPTEAEGRSEDVVYRQPPKKPWDTPEKIAEALDVFAENMTLSMSA